MISVRFNSDTPFSPKDKKNMPGPSAASLNSLPAGNGASQNCCFPAHVSNLLLLCPRVFELYLAFLVDHMWQHVGIHCHLLPRL